MKSRSSSPRPMFAALVVLTLFNGQTLNALTWYGSLNTNMSEVYNWTPLYLPGSPILDAIYFAGNDIVTFGMSGSIATIDEDFILLKGIVINRTANFTIANGFEPGHTYLGIGSEGISATSPFTHTISVNRVALNASQTWRVEANSRLNVSSSLTNSTGNTLTKAGTGILELTGNSTYSGQTQILAGTVNVVQLDHYYGGTQNSNLGRPPLNTPASTIIMGQGPTSGTLRFGGAGNPWTLRTIQVGSNSPTGPALTDNGGAVIQNDGTRMVVFDEGGAPLASVPYFNIQETNVVAVDGRLITLQGSNTDLNQIRRIIQDNSGPGNASVGLVKKGIGNWRLAGTASNTYTGGTWVTEGGLGLAKSNAVAVQRNITIGGGTSQAFLLLEGDGGNQVADSSVLTFQGSGNSTGVFRMNGRSEKVGGIVSTGASGVVENNTPATASTLEVSNGADYGFSGTLQDGAGGGTLALVKSNSGTLTLSGLLNYTGGTSINDGTLVLNTGVLHLGTLVGPTTVNPGGVLRLDHTGGKYPTAGDDTISVVGGTLELKGGAGNGSFGNIGRVNLTSANGQGARVTTADGSHLLFSSSTISSGNFPIVLANPGTISSTGTTANHWDAPILLESSNGGIGLGDINPMNIEAGPGNTLNITGAIRDAASSEARVVRKQGPGTVKFTGANTYLGGTVVDGGTLILNSGGFFDGIIHGTATVNAGAVLRLDFTGGKFPINGSDTVNVNGGGVLDLVAGAGPAQFHFAGTVNLSSTNGSGASVTTADGSYLSFGYLVANGLITSTGPAANTWATNMVLFNQVGRRMTIDTAANNTLNVTGAISDYVGWETLPVFKTGTGTLELSGNVANNYAGLTTINGGMLVLGKANGRAITGPVIIGDGVATPGLDVLQLAGTGGDQIADTSILGLLGTGSNAGVFRLNGLSETVGGLTSTDGAGIVENNHPGTAILTLAPTANRAFAGVLRDGAAGPLALVKTGSATQTLSGNNTYTGNTTIQSGVLSLSTPSLDDHSTMTIGTAAPSTAVLNLNHSSADKIRSLIIHGAVMPDGVYDSSHPSGAITGSGSLWVGPSAFSTWLESHPTLTDRSPGGDSDQDGVSNLLEFVLDGNPNLPDAARLPAGYRWNHPIYPFDNYYAFTFYRRADSIPEVGLRVEVGTDLKSWWDIEIKSEGSYLVSLEPLVSGSVSLGAVVDGMQQVTVNVPANSPQLFARLKASGSFSSGNLLQNGSGANPPTTGWTILENGGDGWAQTPADGYDATPGYFRTSYEWCRRSQTIDLVAAGFTAAALDNQPLIRVGEVISSFMNNNVPDSYYVKVELRDQNQNVITTWNAGTQAAPLTAGTAWVLNQHDFTNYGPGVRYVYFEDGGIDNGYWAGPFGTYHDAASVEIIGN